MDETIAGYRKSLQSSLQATRNLKKIHKEHGIPWTKDLNEQGTNTRGVLRVFIKVFNNIRREMAKATRDANQHDPVRG